MHATPPTPSPRRTHPLHRLLRSLPAQVHDAIVTDYEYDCDASGVYVWPHVEELQDRRRSHEDIPAAHMTVRLGCPPRMRMQHDSPAVHGDACEMCMPLPLGFSLIRPHEPRLQVMKKFVAGFSGICNFNYKVRPDGGMCIFEVNARVGADLACDVPRRRAAAFFGKLDAIGPTHPPATA